MSARNTTPSLIGTATLCCTPIPYWADGASKVGVSGDELVRRGERLVVEPATRRGTRSFIPRRYDVAVGVAHGGSHLGVTGEQVIRRWRRLAAEA